MAWGKNHYNQSYTREARQKRTYDNIEFDSESEMARYRDVLKPLFQMKKIVDIEFQPKFYLDILEHRLGFYTADFQYKDELGNIFVEEIKGNKENREFSIKWKIVQLLNPNLKFLYYRATKRGIRHIFEIVKRVASPIKNPSSGRRGKN